MSRFLQTICIVLLLAGYASANMTVWFDEVDNSTVLSGYRTWDVMLDTDSEWLDSELLLELTAGTVFQATTGTDLPPSPDDFITEPALEFDSFLAAGSTDYGSDPFILGGAVDIGGGSAATLDTTGADVTWCPVSSGNIGQLCMARITLSDAANGGWTMRMVNLDDGELTFTGDITAGAILGGVTPVPDLPGDANNDGIVNAADAAALADNWQTMGGATWAMGDFNNDGNVNDIDATILATNWQTTPASSSVPEPAAVFYLATMLLGLATFVRRRSKR